MDDAANQDDDTTGTQTDLDITNHNSDEGYTERVSDIISDIIELQETQRLTICRHSGVSSAEIHHVVLVHSALIIPIFRLFIKEYDGFILDAPDHP